MKNFMNLRFLSVDRDTNQICYYVPKCTFFFLLVFGCMGGSWELVKIKIISKGIPLPDSCQLHLPWARERVPWIMWKISPDSTWCWLWCYKLYLLTTGKFVRIKDFIGRFFDCLLGKCTLRVFFDK